MLEITNLTKHYGKILGVKDLSLTVKEGEIFGFIGPNGAGKSTTIRLIMNMINKDSGMIKIAGIDNSENEAIKPMVGYLPSEIHLYDDLKVIDMLILNAKFYNEDLNSRIKYLSKKLELDLNKKIEDLSFGNLKKVGIALALMHSPKLLILDEATSGLDPLMQEKFFELLLEEKKKGTTIFFSSHILSEVKRICDRVGIIKDGHLVAIEDINKITKTDFSIITIVSDDYKKLKLPMRDIVIKEQSSNMIKFIYRGNINNFLKIASEINIISLLIEEPSLEEVFMHYYV